MIELTEPEVMELASNFVIANTPASFARWLRQNATVSRIVQNLPEEAIIDGLYTLANNPTRNEEVLSQAYAYLVALTIKRTKGGALGHLPIAEAALAWAKPIWDYAFRHSRSTGEFVIVNAPTTKVINDAHTAVILNEFGLPAVEQI